MAVLATFPYLQFLDANGDPLTGGTVTTYANNTTTLKATYTKAAATVEAPNPIQLNASGIPQSGNGGIWIDGSYTFVVKDQFGVTIDTQNDVNSFQTTITSTTSSSIAGGYLNKFRNPGMTIWQRSTTVSVPSGSANYTADGWVVSATGATAIVSQAGPLSYSPNSLQITGNTGMTDTFIRQRISSETSTPMANQRVTIRLFFWNAATGIALTPTLTVRTPTAVDNYASTNSIVTSQPLQQLIIGQAGVLAYSFDCPSSASNGLEITIGVGGALNSNAKYVYMSDFDIRTTSGSSLGLISNPQIPELRPYAAEYPLNYYYLPAVQGLDNKFIGNSTTTINTFVPIPFKYAIRSAPTSISLSSVAHYTLANGTNTTGTPTAIAFNTAGTNGAELTVTTTAGAPTLTAGQSARFYANNSAASVLFLGLEI